MPTVAQVLHGLQTAPTQRALVGQVASVGVSTLTVTMPAGTTLTCPWVGTKPVAGARVLLLLTESGPFCLGTIGG